MVESVIGLALGSGAARGWSHIGILEVLEEEGIKVDVVAGCSIGALVGAAYMAGRLDDLRNWVKTLRWRDVASLLDVSLNGGGLIEGKLIERKLVDLGIEGDIEDLEKPFATVATDYLSGREEWLRTGPIGAAVRASISLPGIFKPVNIGGDWFVDGGLVNPVPVSTCRALGANFIIAVNLNGDLVGRRELPKRDLLKNASLGDAVERTFKAVPKIWRKGTVETVSQFLQPKAANPGYFDVLANSINIMQDRITRSRLAGEPPHVMITPRLGAMGILDFDKAEPALEEGRKCAAYALPEIRRHLSNGPPSKD